MKKLILSFVICLLALSAYTVVCAAPSGKFASYDAAQYDALVTKLGKEIFADMDFSDSALSEVKKIVNEANYDAALTAYKTYWMDRNLRYYKNKMYAAISNAVNWEREEDAAKKLLATDKIVITDRSSISEELSFGKPGHYNWGIGVQESNLEYSDGNIYAEYTNMYWTACLAGQYLQTGERAYLDKWLDIWMDYDLNFGLYGTPTAISCQMYTYNGFISCLKAERKFHSRLPYMNEMYEYNPKAFLEAYDNVAFANQLLSAINEMKNIRISIESPNQSLTGCKTRIKYYFMLKDFKSVVPYYEQAVERYAFKLMASCCKDGLDPEMSPKYNAGVAGTLSDIKAIYDAVGFAYPDGMNQMLGIAINRLRALSAIVTSDGKYPNLGEDSYVSTGPRGNQDYIAALGGDAFSQNIIDYKLGLPDSKEPLFTSIAFPYVGYYVMRSNWETDGEYLFFKGARWSGGHSDDSQLQLMYFNRGERLLIDAGAQGYSVLPVKDYFLRSYAHNTITVDDATQMTNNMDAVNLTNAMLSFSKPLDSIWYTDQSVDITDGTYTTGYGHGLDYEAAHNDINNKAVTDVTHNRTVVNDKENDIVVVFDRINSRLPHTITMNWNFASKFNDYGTVCADGDEKWIKTALDDGMAGLDLYNITKNNMDYQVECGEYPEGDRHASGWINLDAFVDIHPIVHVNGNFKGNCGKQGVLSLLTPKTNNQSDVVELNNILEDQGFDLKLNNGARIICVAGQTDRTNFEYNGFSMTAKLFYLCERSDGSAWGIVRNGANVKFSGKSCVFGCDSYVFTITDGKMKLVAPIQTPNTFEWQGAGTDLIPSYGFRNESERIRY